MYSKENKHHNTIIFAVAKLMVHSIFQMLKNNEFHDGSKLIIQQFLKTQDSLKLP